MAVLGSQGIVVKCTAAIFYRTVDWKQSRITFDIQTKTALNRVWIQYRNYATDLKEIRQVPAYPPQIVTGKWDRQMDFYVQKTMTKRINNKQHVLYSWCLLYIQT